MAFLSNLFGGDDSSNDSANSSDFMSDFDAVLSIDASNENYHSETDDDGSSETTYSAQNFGTDLDVGSLIHNLTDSFSSSDTDSDSGSFFG